jgi:hypothetical protein
MKYLGVPISYKHLNMAAFNLMTQKMVKRLDPWKGKLVSYGGRHTLTNSCLSSIPLYCMVFICSRMVFTKLWILLELSSFGRVLRRSLSTIWLSLKWYVGQKTKGVWEL